MQGAVLRLQIWKTHFRLSGLSHLAPEQDLQQLQENTHLQNYISHLQPLRICTPRKNQRWLTELKTHPPNSGAHWPPRSPTAEGGRARDLFNSLCDRSLPSGVICSRSLHSRPCTDETQTDAPVSLKCTNDQVCSAEQQDEKETMNYVHAAIVTRWFQRAQKTPQIFVTQLTTFFFWNKSGRGNLFLNTHFIISSSNSNKC